jgi:hypothetical protein
MKKVLIFAAMTALTVSRASAAQDYDAKYFEIASSPVGEIIEKGGGIMVSTDVPTIPSPGDLPKPPSGPQINPPGPTGPTGPSTNDQLDTLDKIVNLVDKIFTIIAKGQPVVNINVNYASAVPYGTSHWTQLQGWSKPSTKKYGFVMKNGYGTEVVKVIYQVHWTHSGNFNGAGKFLTGVTVEPLSVTTAYGYNVDLTAEVPDSTIANVGTTANPIAAMQVQLKWKVHTIFKDVQQKVIYYVQGDGYMKQIATPFEQGLSVSPQKSAGSQQQLDKVTERLQNFKF